MKICYLIAHPGYGGSENYSLYLAEEAKKAGHDVYFVLSKEGPLSEVLKETGTKTDFIEMKSSFNPYLVLKASLALRRFAKEKEIEIVHANQLREHSLAIAAKIFGAKIKVVRTFHRIGQFNLKMRIISALYNLWTDAFIAVSVEMKKSMEENHFKRKITLIYNGVPEVKAEKHENAIGFLGRTVPEKGIVRFLTENLKEIKENIVIGGDGKDFEKLKILAVENKNIMLLGNVLNRKDFFGKVSLLVLPSETEAMPLTMLEAFSASVPVLAFDLPSLREVIKNNENGFLIKVGDYRGLYKKSEEVLRSEKLLCQLGQKAREDYDSKYSIEKMWQKTESLYKELLS